MPTPKATPPTEEMPSEDVSYSKEIDYSDASTDSGYRTRSTSLLAAASFSASANISTDELIAIAKKFESYLEGTDDVAESDSDEVGE